MSYALQQNGSKADIMDKLRAQANAQRTALPSEAERQMLDAGLEEAEKQIDQYAGDHDNVAVTISGSLSQAGSSTGISRQVGVTISKMSKADAPAPTVGAASASTPLTGAASTAPQTETTAAAPRRSGV